MSTKCNVLDDHQWLVLYTYPNREKAAAREINNLNIETFLPIRSEYRHWHDRIKRVEVPLFRNYLFVRMSEKQRHQIYNVSHILNFVSTAGKPCIVQEKEIKLIKGLLKGDCNFELIKGFEQGESIEVSQGPFAGWEGQFIRRNSKGRVTVFLPSIGHGISMQIPQQWVQTVTQV